MCISVLYKFATIYDKIKKYNKINRNLLRQTASHDKELNMTRN